MITSAKKIVGLDIFTLAHGKKTAEVGEVIYNPKEQKVKALLVKSRGLFSQPEVIPFENIKNIGNDVVLLEDETMIKRLTEVPESIAEIVREGGHLFKTRMLTEKGEDLGKVQDVYFESLTGEVKEFEVSQGLKDAATGRSRVKVENILNTGEEATIVKGAVMKNVAQQREESGLTGLFNRAVDSTKDRVESLTEKTKDFTDEIALQENLRRVKDQSTQYAKDAAVQFSQINSNTVQRTKENLVGTYATKNILARDNKMIIERGGMINYKILEKAEKEGVLNQLLTNYSSEPLNKEVKDNG